MIGITVYTAIDLLLSIRSVSCFYVHNRIGGIVVSVIASSIAERGFEPRSGQAENL